MQLLDALGKLVSDASLWKCYNCCIIRELLLCFSRALPDPREALEVPAGANPALTSAE